MIINCSNNNRKKYVILFQVILFFVCFVPFVAETSYAEPGDTNEIYSAVDINHEPIRAEVDNLLDFMDEAPEGDLDKLLAIHEYICMNYSYDYKGLDGQLGRPQITEACDMAAYKWGVCDAYGRIFRHFADSVGFEAEYVSGKNNSNGIAHAWNSVKLNGSWYRVDTTRDGSHDCAGFSERTNFMRSDAVFSQSHSGYWSNQTSAHTAEDTTYDDYWWNSATAANGCCHDKENSNYSAAIVPFGGYWYYYSNSNGIVKRDSAFDGANVIQVKSHGSINDGTVTPVRRIMTIHNGKIYAVGAKSGKTVLYSMNTDGTDLRLVMNLNYSAAELRSLGTRDGRLYAGLAPENGARNSYSVPLTLPGESEFVNATGVSIQPGNIDDLTEPMKLSVNVSPSNATNKKIIWGTGNLNVVQVKPDGTILPMGEGTTTISAMTSDGHIEDRITVTVPKSGSSIIWGNTLRALIDYGDGRVRLMMEKPEGAERFLVYTFSGISMSSNMLLNSYPISSHVCTVSDLDILMEGFRSEYYYIFTVVPVCHDGLGDKIMCHKLLNEQTVDITRAEALNDTSVRISWNKDQCIEQNKYYGTIVNVTDGTFHTLRTRDTDSYVIDGLMPDKEYEFAMANDGTGYAKGTVKVRTPKSAEMILAEAKESAIEELDNYKDPELYRAEQRELLLQAVANGKTAINKAVTVAAVTAALTSAKNTIDRIKTDAEMTAEELEEAKTVLQDAITVANNVNEECYMDDTLAALSQAKIHGLQLLADAGATIAQIEAATGDINEILSAPDAVILQIDANGGTLQGEERKKVRKGSTVEAPVVSAPEGCRLLCWKEEGDPLAWDFGNPLQRNIVLKACWEPLEYIVRYIDRDNVFTEVSVPHGTSANVPDEPVREHYDFTGWFVDRQLDEKYDFGKPVYGNTELYAGWTETTYTVSFDSDGGGDVEPQSVRYTEYASEPDPPVKEGGWIFEGWYTDKGSFLYRYDFKNRKVKKDIILYAKWERAFYKVTFDTNGGGHIDDVLVEHGKKIDSPPDPEKEGLTFDGWYTDNETFLWRYDFERRTVKSAFTLYAKWQKNAGGGEDPGTGGGSSGGTNPGSSAAKDNTEAGGSSPVISGGNSNNITGNRKGADTSVKKTFPPGKVSLKKAMVKGRTVTVEWKGIKKNVKGYQIRLKNKKTGRIKTKIIKKPNKKKKIIKKKIKKLKKGKYTIQVRAYNIKDGKKHYGPWSKKKTVRVT